MFRYSVKALFLLALAHFGCAPRAEEEKAPEVNVQAEKDSLMAADEAWSKTVGDATAFASHFSPDAKLFPPDAPLVTGSDAIREFVTALMQMPGFSLNWNATMADVASSGDLGYTIGTYQMSFNDPSGNPVASEGKYVTVWRKQADGQWKPVADIFNSNGPPGAAATEEKKQ